MAQARVLNVDEGQKYVWNNHDWDRVAVEIQRTHPDWKTVDFSMSHFDDAMESVIPQEHQRMFNTIEEVKPELFAALERVSKGQDGGKVARTLKNKPRVTETVTGAIRWTPYEWQDIVLEIHRIRPMHFAQRCVNLTLHDIRAAQSILPKHRHREPNQLEIYRKQLLKTWDALPADVKDVRQQDRKIVDFPSGPVMEPPKQRSDDASAIATAMHKGFQAQVPPVEPIKATKQKRNHYTSTDWLNIAREMHRQNPHAPYFTSAFQTVDLPALRAAQREIIPKERRRNITSNFGLATPLVAAFAALKLEIDATKTEPEVAQVERTVIQPIPVVELPPVVALVSRPAAQVAPTDFLERLTQAAKSLIGVLVDEFRNSIAQEVAKILLPQITASISPMMESAVKDVKEAIAEQFNTWHDKPTIPSNNEELCTTTQEEKKTVQVVKPAKSVEKPKKPKIAIVGPSGSQKDQIIRAFPEFDFVFIDNGHGIKEAGASCALFVAVSAYMNRANRDNMRSYVPSEKVRNVDGGISSIKRTINIWKATQKT